MRLDSIEGNRQHLDGGAMFGNVPRALWSRWHAPDDQGRIELACRALLVRETSGRTLLLEAGIGAFFEPKLRARFGVEPAEHLLLRNLAAVGVAPADVDVIVLSHLHFDHAGGLLEPWREGAPPALAFPRARYVVGARAWARARSPHPRDRASFIPGLCDLLEGTGRLERVDAPRSATLGEEYELTFSDGHTPGMMLTTVPAPDGPITFAADLIPGAAWVHVPITMGYDRFPERLIDEKQALLERELARDGRLLFTHDPEAACARLTRDDQGRFLIRDPQPTVHESG